MLPQTDQLVLVVKNLPASAGDARDVGSIPESGTSPAVGNSNPFQYSCLENFIDGGAWWATFHGVEKSWTRQRLTLLINELGESNGTPLQYSCLENPIDVGTW